MLGFINIGKIKDFQKIILDKLDTYQNLSRFIKYLKSYLFKLSPNIYNYSEYPIFWKRKWNIFLDKLYTTNNICESLNSKFAFYLPKKKQIIIIL